MLRIESAPDMFELTEDMLGGYGGFPEQVFLITVEGDKYAANNISLPDGGKSNGLAAFPSPDDATSYMAMLAGLSGDIVAKKFEEARQIAISKPILDCVLLFHDNHIVDICYVR